MPLFHLLMRDYPEITKCMARRHLMYNSQLEYIAEQESIGNIIILCPERPLKIGRTEQNADKMMSVHERGRICALQNLQRIKDFLAEKKTKE
jgi:predicted patatin/cPLA2 family phospholipase